ncbi:DEAD/DEAH box helicase [Sphingobacterium faecium]|uniref:DEAD/DEAH box helicase n=1 Tax=Sphingobacterium faecium TaxID=34087 RepID=UPI00320A0CFF
MNSYFYCNIEKNTKNASLIERFESFSIENKHTIYLIDKPLGDKKYKYKYNEGLIILRPKYKIAIINYGAENSEGFEDYVEDLIEDIGAISDKHNYKDVIGRMRTWRNEIFETSIYKDEITDISSFFYKTEIIESDLIKKKSELLVSLLIGSINDIDRVKEEVPLTVLDKVKQKIQLFDGDQTRFIYQKPSKKRISIQGLSGTGKTELLLHKLKDLYVSDESNRIFFTCHNRILADNLRKRIPDFFNFMKVEQQIAWDNRLWCSHSWGSRKNPNSGAYAYICNFYNIPISTWSPTITFSRVCEEALEKIKIIKERENEKFKYALDYILIDESQDFTESFFSLCEIVTKHAIYIAGDIFQSIFDARISNIIEPDYLLGKCYRTDPKTLMFSHALGMGLFENYKLRWLEKKEWEDCGYNVEIDRNIFTLTREPLRRFEDINDDYKSIEIVKLAEIDSFGKDIIKIINKIKEENPTVQKEDIGIIFLDNTQYTYRLADIAEAYIRKFLNWEVNKTYESKTKVSDRLLISNRNNVKGLEFPFVICITMNIHRGLSYRNSLYTMLSRSFIKTYFVLPEKNSGLIPEIEKGLATILNDQKMIVKEPTEAEKDLIKTSFEYDKKEISKYDLIQAIMIEEGIEDIKFEKIQTMALNTKIEEQDKASLRQFIMSILDFI